MDRANNILVYLITIIGVLIAIIAPVPFPQEYRLVVIVTILFVFIAIVLSEFSRRLDDYEENQLKLEEKLKIHEQLIDVKASIIDLQKRVSKV